MGNLPGTEKALGAESGRAGEPSANPWAGGSVAAGRGPTSRPWRAPPQRELLGRPEPRKVFLPRRAQKLLPAPSRAKEAGRAFDRAWRLPPAAGSLRDPLVGTVWGGLERASLCAFSRWAGGGDAETVGIVLVAVLLGRDGRRLLLGRGSRRVEARILCTQRDKLESDPQPQSGLSGKCGCGKNTLARAGQPWVALGWTRPGKAGV